MIFETPPMLSFGVIITCYKKTRQQYVRDTWDNRKSAALQGYLCDKKTTLKAGHDYYPVIPIGSYIFRISHRLGLQINVGDEVLVHFDFSDTPHPHAHASKARIDDSACRLDVSIRRHTIREEYFCWLTTDWDFNVLKMNSLVEILEGYTWKDSASFKRRWYLRRLIPGERSSRSHAMSPLKNRTSRLWVFLDGSFKGYGPSAAFQCA